MPLLTNIVEGGRAPARDAAALQRAGFHRDLPGRHVRAVAHTLGSYHASLAAHGGTAPGRDRMLDFDGLDALIGTSELLAHGKRQD